MTIECIKYIPINKGCCLGIASIYVDTWDMEINSITLNSKDGSRWINVPSKKYEKDGVTKYSNYIHFRSPDTYKRFCEGTKEAIDKYIECNGTQEKCTVTQEKCNGTQNYYAKPERSIPTDATPFDDPLNLEESYF